MSKKSSNSDNEDREETIDAATHTSFKSKDKSKEYSNTKQKVKEDYDSPKEKTTKKQTKDKKSSDKKSYKDGSNKKHSSNEADEYTSINQRNIEILNKYNPRMNFLDLHIEPLKAILFDRESNISYAYWITGGNSFIRAMMAAAFTFFEDQRLNKRSSLADLIESTILPSELIKSLSQLKDKKMIEAINEDEKVKNHLGDFILRSILKSSAVENCWGPDVTSITSIEWEAISQLTSADIEVYSYKEELTRTLYEVPGLCKKNDTMRFLVDNNAIGILYTTEQAKGVGHNTKYDSKYIKEYEDIRNKLRESRINIEVDHRSKKRKDYIEVLETVITELGGKEVLNDIRDQLDNQDLDHWDKLKAQTRKKLNKLIENYIEEAKNAECNKCKAGIPSYKLHKMSCKHFLDMDCIKK